MNIPHGGPIIQKPINEIAKYIKNLIPANIPVKYALKPIFKNVASEENIRTGIIAFRDFLYLFCDRLISDGHLYFKLQKNPKHEIDYPFIYIISDLLIDIGYHSKLTESGDSLLITEIPSFTACVDENGNKKNPKHPGSKLIECLRFLNLCGFVFTGIDLKAKMLKISKEQPLVVSYPNNPILLTGLKVMSIADAQPRGDRWRNGWRNNDVFLRCDYRIMKAEDTDVLDILKDFVYPLSEKVQNFALELHQRYTDMGMTCLTFISLFEFHFVYTYTKKSRRVLSSQDIYQQRVWEFALSTKYGYCLVVRAKNTNKYAKVIENFPLSLQEKIEKGYGCDRKLRNEHCQNGCHGIRIPLDDSILNTGRDIETWLDNEVSCYLKK